MIGMLEEICGQIIFEIIIFGIILILVDAGMSESQAQLTIIITAIIFLIIAFIRLQMRRKALGKTIVLDADGDGRISEEEWAASGMPNENEGKENS